MNSQKKKIVFSYNFLLKFNKNKNKYISLFLSLFVIVNTYNYYNKNDIKICLCAIVKNENLYIREFVDHYKKIGYNNIIIYDNNDEGGEYFEKIIEDYIESGFIKIIKINDFREKSPDKIPQFYAYKDCYSRFNKLYDWLSFFDIDEFLEIDKKYGLIQDFLKDKIFNRCKNIKVNWLVYHDENILYYENKTLQERIKKYNYSNPINRHIKSTVRGNLSKNYWEKLENPHTSLLRFTSCSSSGKKIMYNSPFNDPPDYTNALLKHYCNKSFEEYCLKLKRGRADANNNSRIEFFNETYTNLLLEIKGNSEKLKIFHKILNDSQNLFKSDYL